MDTAPELIEVTVRMLPEIEPTKLAWIDPVGPMEY